MTRNQDMTAPTTKGWLSSCPPQPPCAALKQRRNSNHLTTAFCSSQELHLMAQMGKPETRTGGGWIQRSPLSWALPHTQGIQAKPTTNSFRLQKPSEIIKSITNPYPQIPPGIGTPLSWAASSSAWQPFWWRNFPDIQHFLAQHETKRGKQLWCCCLCAEGNKVCREQGPGGDLTGRQNIPA